MRTIPSWYDVPIWLLQTFFSVWHFLLQVLLSACFHAPVFLFPILIGAVSYPVFSIDIRNLHTGIGFSKNRDALSFGES